MKDLEIIIKYDEELEELKISNGGYWWDCFLGIKTPEDIERAIHEFIIEELKKGD